MCESNWNMCESGGDAGMRPLYLVFEGRAFAQALHNTLADYVWAL